MMSVCRTFISNTVTVLIALGLAAPIFANPPAEGERICVIKGVMGEVMVRRNPAYNKVRREQSSADVRIHPAGSGAAQSAQASDGWTRARVNMPLREKDEIRTGAGAEVRLETPEGTVIKLSENSSVEIAALRYGADPKRPATPADRRAGITNTKVKVNDGSVVSNVKKLPNKESSIRFETPTATAAIRGTVVELEVRGNEHTEIKVFDGAVLVAPSGTDKFVEVGDNKMVEIVPEQKAIIVKEVPKEYERKTTRLRNEKIAPEELMALPAEAPAVAAAPTVKLTLDFGDGKDTVSCYARDSVTIKGRVEPASAKVSVNDIALSPDSTGAFVLTMAAPADSGAYPIKITAENGEVSETVIRTMNVAHVYTATRLLTPTEGQVVDKPSVTVSGTASPGSRVHVDGANITVNRNGTFSGEVPIADAEGEYRIHVEIVGKDDNAVWIERNIIYKKK